MGKRRFVESSNYKTHNDITLNTSIGIEFHCFSFFFDLGLDSVITQMLNQMENAGPPPLSKEKIQDVPRVEISDEQVEQKLQCSVCWDNFERMETVRQLPCTVNWKILFSCCFLLLKNNVKLNLSFSTFITRIVLFLG